MQLLIKLINFEFLIDILLLKFVNLLVKPRELSLHEAVQRAYGLSDLICVLTGFEHRCQVGVYLDFVHQVFLLDLGLVKDVLAVDRHAEGLLDDRTDHILQRLPILVVDDGLHGLLRVNEVLVKQRSFYLSHLRLQIFILEVLL